MIVERNGLKRAAASWVHTDTIKIITLKKSESLKWQLQTLRLSRKFKSPVLALVLNGLFQQSGL